MSEKKVTVRFEPEVYLKEIEHHPMAERRKMIEAKLQEKQLELNKIKQQIEQNKYVPGSTQHADRDWWVRVNGARRAVGFQVQALQTALGKLPRGERVQPDTRPLAEYFVTVAKKELDPEVYLRLMNQAKQDKFINDVK